jgi:hypothetical protein
MKKTTLIATTGAVVLVAGMLVPSMVMADDTERPFLQRVADKVDVSVTDLENAMNDVRVEDQAERDAVLEDAYDNGDITKEQYDLILAIRGIRAEERENHEPGTRPERVNILDALNDAGYDVTQSDLDELHDVMANLGLDGYGPMGGFGGRGMGMGRD